MPVFIAKSKQNIKNFRQTYWINTLIRNLLIILFCSGIIYGVTTLLSDAPLCTFVYLIYLVSVTLYVTSRDFFLVKPIDIYLFITAIGFGFFLPYYYNNPEHLFFFNDWTYVPQFRFDKSDLVKSFYVFLLGLVSFCVGTFSSNKARRIYLKEYKPGIQLLSIVSTAIVLIFSAFRIYFKIRLPGNNDIAFPFVGYIFNPGLFAVNIITTYCICYILEAKTKLDVVLLMMPGFLYAISLAVIGVKSGFIFYIITIFLFYQLLKIKKWLLDAKIRRTILVLISFQLLIAYLSYGFIGFYRNLLMGSGYNLVGTMYDGVFQDYLTHVGEAEQGFSDAKTFAVFERIAGINYLAPTVAFYNSDKNVEFLPIVQSVFFSEDTNPENYLTREILGVPDNVITTSAPGGIGALYIQGGAIGVVLGMLGIGFLSNKVFNVLTLSAMPRNVAGSIYIVFILQILIPVLIEGTIFNFLKTNLPSMFLGAVFFLIILNIMHKSFRPKNGKRAVNLSITHISFR